MVERLLKVNACEDLPKTNVQLENYLIQQLVLITIGGHRLKINDGGILHGIRRLEIFPLRIGGHSLLGKMICIKSP